MTENLRYGNGYKPAEPETLFDYRKQESFVRAVELCNGAGVCRKQQGGTMCPSFRATLDEEDSTRARANALRLALASKQPVKNLRSRWVYQVLDLCLMCKACKAECPSNVDLAKLKSEFLSFYYQGRPRPLGHFLMGRIHAFNRMSAWAAPVINWMQNRRLFRWLLQSTAGIDRRRSLPPLRQDHFRHWFAKHRPPNHAGSRGQVILLDDCFTTYQEPEIGQAAVRVLEAAGYKVKLAGIPCCCRPMISKGMLKEARNLIHAESHRLAKRLGGGTPILGLEPSCILALADEWPELYPSADTRAIASAAELADEWLARQIQEKKTDLKFRPSDEKCVLHGHCHQKALRGTDGSAAALRLIPGLNVEVLDAGCCGMAGSFGYEEEHYDLSVKIANLAVLPALAAQPQAQIAATGTSCRHQIKDLAQRHALHPLQILEKQLE